MTHARRYAMSRDFFAMSVKRTTRDEYVLYRKMRETASNAA